MFNKTVQLIDSSKVVISINDEGEEILAVTDDGKKGTITLNFDSESDYFHLTDLSFENIKHRGIGKESIKFHKECFDLPIIATPNDGQKEMMEVIL
ncbi:hypothetical protein [Teredinibacter haidensis]|uniref:hypothetical protein n=1 Tax=Teredinibacter haidensis TaxID=2731755 RepID=UPI0009489225|nr:hypothetical protein [Teredinibacter haidensis]